ncbi:hypothetical protein HK405_009072 [Cladochytrium tenue]|nr:hypothetical protein HK405_009072 [Cladochytrium tenue]
MHLAAAVACLLAVATGARASGGAPSSSTANSSSKSVSTTATTTSAAAAATTTATASVGCNGLEEACALTLDKMSFVGAHNAASNGIQCVTVDSVNSCGLGSAFQTCAYQTQASDLATLLGIGVRWLDIAFVGFNPADTTQAYSAHNSDSTEFGIAYGPSASSVFATIGSFLASNPNDTVVLSLKSSERDANITQADGANGYDAFFAALRASSAGAYLAGNALAAAAAGSSAWPTMQELVNQGARLVVLGWNTIPSDVGLSSVAWFADSWNNPEFESDLASEATTACAKSLPVVLQEILPFDGVCVSARATDEVLPYYSTIVESCAASTSVLAVLVDYIASGDPVFTLVQDMIRTKAAA